jgi:hypothetical protein
MIIKNDSFLENIQKFTEKRNLVHIKKISKKNPKNISRFNYNKRKI